MDLVSVVRNFCSSDLPAFVSKFIVLRHLTWGRSLNDEAGSKAALFLMPGAGNLRRAQSTLMYMALALALLVVPGIAAERVAKGLILYAEPPSTYVEAMEFTTLTRQSVRYTTLIGPTGQRSEIHTGGIVATIPYPDAQEQGDLAAKAADQLKHIEAVTHKYPQFRSRLEPVAARWRNAAAIRTSAPGPTPASSSRPEGMVIVTNDGTRYEGVSINSVTADVVSFTHSAGAATIDLQQLPAELQRKFNYDPKRAEAARLAKAEVSAKRGTSTGAGDQGRNPPQSSPRRSGASSFKALMTAYRANNTDAIQEKNLQKDRYYYVGGGAFQPFFIAQAGDDFVLAANVRKQPWAVLTFDNPGALESLQMPGGSQAQAVGRFVGFKTFEMASGACERLPLFSCVGIEVVGGGFANTEVTDR